MPRHFPTDDDKHRKSSVRFVLNTPCSSFDMKGILPELPASTYSGHSKKATMDIMESFHRTSMQSTVSSASSITGGPYSGTRGAPLDKVNKAEKRKRNRKRAKCSICEKDFADMSSVRKHVRVVHMKVKQHECNECGQLFGEKSNLSKHYLAKHINERRHECIECGKCFNFSDGLKRHYENVHMGLRPHICAICGLGYKQKSHLHKHMTAMHGGATHKAWK